MIKFLHRIVVTTTRSVYGQVLLNEILRSKVRKAKMNGIVRSDGNSCKAETLLFMSALK